MSEHVMIDSIPGVLLGALLGGLASGGMNYFRRDQNMANKLAFHPNCFHTDSFITEAFLKLQRFRPYSSEAFDESGSQVDALLCLEQQLETGEEAPTMFHETYARRYSRSARAFLQRFANDVEIKIRKRALKHNLPKEQVLEELEGIKGDIQAIDSQVRSHIKYIQSLYQESDKRTHPMRAQFQYPLY